MCSFSNHFASPGRVCVCEVRSEACTGVVGGGPHQSVRRGVHGLELDFLADGVVGADFEHLLASHQQAVALLHRVEEDLEVSHATLLPLVELAVPAVELGSFFEQDLLVLLAGPHLHLQEHINTRHASPETRGARLTASQQTLTSGRDTIGSKWISSLWGVSSSLPSSSPSWLVFSLSVCDAALPKIVAPVPDHKELSSAETHDENSILPISMLTTAV